MHSSRVPTLASDLGGVLKAEKSGVLKSMQGAAFGLRWLCRAVLELAIHGNID